MTTILSETVYYEHYRESHLGQSLLETLDELVTSNRMSGPMAVRMMFCYDRIVAETLAIVDTDACIKITGHLDYYQEIYPEYCFMVDNPLIKMRSLWKVRGRDYDGAVEVTGKLKIVALKAGKDLGVVKDEE